MSFILPFAVMYLASKRSSAAPTPKHKAPAPKWPKPAPAAVAPPAPPAPAAPPVENLHQHTSPAMQRQAPARARRVPKVGPRITRLPVQVIKGRVPPPAGARTPTAPTVAPPPVRAVPQPQTVNPGDKSVAQVQKILRALGWKGRDRTTGALSTDLTDGLFGPTTADCWMRSAKKRNLPMTFQRLGPQSVRVDPQTYAALANIASNTDPSIVVGLYVP